MNTTKLFVAVLFVIAFFTLKANEGASIDKVIQIKGFVNDEIGGIVQADDGNYYMILNILSSDVEIDSLKFDSGEWVNKYPDMCIVRFDADLKVDTMYMIEKNVYGYLYEIYDGKLRIGGRYFDSEKPKIFQGIYTLDGDKLWSKIINTDFYNFIRYDLSDRSTYFVASSDYGWNCDGIKYERDNGYRLNVFGKFDEAGNTLWTNAMYGNGQKSFDGHWQREKGSYLIKYTHECDTLRFNGSEIVTKEGEDLDKEIFVEFDENGKVKKYTELAGKGLSPSNVLVIGDLVYTRVYFNNKLYWGNDSIVAPDGEYYSRYFVRLNLNGTIESKLFCEVYFDNLWPLPDGNFVGTFFLQKNSDARYGARVFSNESDLRHQYLVKIDPSGNILAEVFLGAGFSNRLDFTVDEENERIHLFIDERNPISFSWQGQDKQEQFYYCSYDFSLNEVDYLKLADNYNYIESGEFYIRNNGENELLGHFRLIGLDSVNFGGGVYYNTKRWEDSSYYEDFLFTMHVSSKENKTRIVTKPEGVSLSAYPNPFKDYLTLDYEGEVADVSVYSLTGEIVYRDQITDGQLLDMGALNKGIYLLVLRINGKSCIQKLEKM